MATEAPAGDRLIVEVPPPEPTLSSQVLGEIVGSFLLATLGLGIGVASFVYGHQTGVTWFGDIWPTSFGWALAIALAIYCTASLSGAHFNPAVTIALAATGRHPWNRVPHYIGCQLVGWFLGAALVVALFGRDIHAVANSMHIKYGAPGSAKVGSILTTYVPNPGVFGTGSSGTHLVPIWTGLLAEVLGTAVLLFVILSLLETRHANAPAAWFFPLIVGSTVGLLIMFVAGLSQASFNGARDLGPRFMLWIMGFGKEAFPGPRHGLALMVTTVGPIIGALVGALFHDKVIRPNIPGVEPEPAITQPGQMAREPARELTTSLHSHAPAMPPLLADDGHGADGIGLVMLDVGGAIYDDDCWAQALMRASLELAGSRFDETAAWHLYDQARQSQTNLTVALAERFLDGDAKRLNDRTEALAQFPPSALFPDVKPTLDVLAVRYKLGVATNQTTSNIEALKRDGLLSYFTVVATPATAGASKTDPKFWKWALDQAGVPAGRAVHVGNRLDSDIRPVKAVGMRAVWLLRGEAPPSPTVEQLTEPDAVVTSFSGVPNALAGLADVRVPAGAA